MKSLLAAGVAFGALLVPAMAADMPLKAPLYKAPPISSWTGCYIGGSAGGDWAKSSWTYRNINPYDAAGPAGPILGTANQFSMSYGIWGGQVGCNYEFYNHLVIGAEGSLAATHLAETNPNVVQVFPGSTQTVATDIDAVYSIAGRLGYSFAPAILGYVKGGFAGAQINTFGTTAPPVAGLNLNWSTAQWHDGFVVGGGFEYRVLPHMTVGLEYDFYGFETVDHTGLVSGGGIGPANQVIHGVNASIQTITARMNLFFGPPTP